VAERQLLVRRAIELDEPPLTAADEDLVRTRLADHERDPSTAIPFDAMKEKLRAAFPA
jgi:putative addiction module component (TIGR02574 family)